MEAVNVPADDSVDFPSNAEFMEDAIPWRNVECNIQFKVLQLNEITTVNSQDMIVKFQKCDNTIVKAWTTKIIRENLLRAKACNEKKNMYILSRGKAIAKRSKNIYYDFKIICK